MPGRKGEAGLVWANAFDGQTSAETPKDGVLEVGYEVRTQRLMLICAARFESFF